MATYALDAVGENTAGSPTSAVAQSASGLKYAIINDTDAAVHVTIVTGGSGVVTIAEGLTHKVDAKSFKMLTVSENGTNTATLALNPIQSAHGTSAQNAEEVYLTGDLA